VGTLALTRMCSILAQPVKWDFNRIRAPHLHRSNVGLDWRFSAPLTIKLSMSATETLRALSIN
jgi:hypothetical protein